MPLKKLKNSLQGLEMKSNKYLYGEQVPPPIPREVIHERIAILNDELFEINKVSYKDRDDKRRNALVNAIKFWHMMEIENG